MRSQGADGSTRFGYATVISAGSALQVSFFVRLEARFSVPTHAISTAARAGAVKDARLRARQGLSLTAPSTPPDWGASGADLLSIGELSIGVQF